MEVHPSKPGSINNEAREAGFLPSLGLLWSIESCSSFSREVIQEFEDWKTHISVSSDTAAAITWAEVCGYCFGCKDIKELIMLLFSVCFSEDPKTLIVSIAEKYYWDEYKLIIFPWYVSEYAYQDLNKHLNQ